jgi:two-component system sensor histidine kinase PilS (NtrC family)
VPTRIAAPLPAVGASADQARVLQWIVFLRVVISFFVLGTIYFIYPPKFLKFPYGLIALNVLVTLLAATRIDRWATRRAFALFQIYWDFLFVSALVYFTGAFFSLFSFLYFLTIVVAAILTGRAHTQWLATLCSVVYAALLIGQELRFLNPLDLDGLDIAPPQTDEVVLRIVTSAMAFFMIGFLGSILGGRAKAAAKQIQLQREAMENLKRLNERIVQSLPIGLMTVDRDEVITFANEHVAPTLGVPDGWPVGRRLADLLPSILAEPVSQEGQDVERQIEPDKRQILSVTSADLRDASGETLGRIVTMQDVTTLRELEQFAKQADRQSAIAQLAAGIAHEIRNPLASMSGSIQLLQSELQLSPVHAHLMDIVVRETDRLNNLINDFLTYARPPQKRDQYADLRDVLEELLGVLVHDPLCQDRIAFQTHLPSSLFCTFDADQFRQLFWNLLINAVQAMEDGAGTLTVNARHSLRHPGFIEVDVQDTGCGIDKEDLKSIFDPFFTTKENGTGLGLTIAYRIIENHGGKIFVDSVVGSGTTFHVLIPCAEFPLVSVGKH